NMSLVYGLTETLPFILYCELNKALQEKSPTEQARITARQGIELAFNGETKVVNDDGKEVAWDGEEIGEIISRGNVIMTGYYKDEEKTAEAMKDGWFYTGDLAVTHPNGYIEIRDRAKDMIISGGEKISSTEVESTLFTHAEGRDVGVVAVPDEKWGEVPKAVIVTQAGAEVTENEIIQHCRDNMSHFKSPKVVEFVDELPKTATGKLQKYRLRAENWDGKKKVN